MTDSSNRRELSQSERYRLGAAIREARGELKQAELGSLIGEQQTAISRWETGEVDINFSQAARIEAALRLPAGWIGRTAGMVDVDLLVVDDPVPRIRMDVFGHFSDVIDELKAAAALGLGVRVTNRFVEREDAVLVEEWTVVLYAEPPGGEL